MYSEHNLHRCCRAQAPDTFTKFERLPGEIRTMIWEYSLPESRVYEILDAPNANQKTPAQKGLMFANVHPEPPPALAAVCRESRYFVLHHYKPLTLGSTTKYVDLSRDMLLLEPYLLVKRLHRTLHFMSQIPMLRDNINRLALGTSYGIYTGICHPVLSWRVSKTNMSKLLSSLAKFPKLKALIFIVHQEFQFEFDFRFPGTMTPIPKEGPPYAVSTLGPPSFGPSPGYMGSNIRPGAGPASAAAGIPRPLALPVAPTATTVPSAARNNNSYPSGYALSSPISPLSSSSSPSPSSQLQLPLPSTLLPPSPPQSQSQRLPQQPTTTTTTTPLNLQPRPQQIHQAYRFKFDIEANINHTPRRRPHLNELLYYPLDIDEDNDDDVWDLNDLDDGEEPTGEQWCDPWPTNDDWRRFRKRWQRAVNLSLEREGEKGEGEGDGRGAGGRATGAGWNCPVRELHGRFGPGGVAKGGGGGGSSEARKTVGKYNVPALKGASLLWRYTRGGYV